jgi:uncharacterized protein DUF397
VNENWQKSSLSFANGNCVEVRWQKSTLSNGSDECVEVCYQKSSLSNGQAQCVEVTIEPGEILVRNSRDREGPVLSFTEGEWEAFIGGVYLGEFDLPEKTSA